MFIMTKKKKDLKHQKPLAYFFAMHLTRCGTGPLHLLNVDAGDCYLYIRIFFATYIIVTRKIVSLHLNLFLFCCFVSTHKQKQTPCICYTQYVL